MVLVAFIICHSPLFVSKVADKYFILGEMSKIGLMILILLVHLKFCWCILYFAGADFEVKSARAKYMHQQNSAVVHQNSAGVHQKIPTLCASCSRGGDADNPLVWATEL